MERMQETAPTEGVGCIIDSGQEAKTEILDDTDIPKLESAVAAAAPCCRLCLCRLRRFRVSGSGAGYDARQSNGNGGAAAGCPMAIDVRRQIVEGLEGSRFSRAWRSPCKRRSHRSRSEERRVGKECMARGSPAQT